MKRWRCRAVAFASVGAVGVIGCYSQTPDEAVERVEMRRNGYASVDVCKQDYPAEPCAVEADFAVLDDCLLQKDLSVCHAEALAAGTAYAWGPWHAAGHSVAPPGDPGAGANAINGVSPLAATTDTTIRGGFGEGATKSSGMSCSGG
ncbi:MAG: hypothetical protein JNJ73_16490 [Hyphomonadaceae bacterium]|nr:hypothetical protein [Hyphomonadaceae bacterium]